ncbi:sigma factor-like helix-turn-helix DNA-binding protein [Metabacillus sp. 84]|uniref:sigma factor-like helix-turn-helix DNA-binding protein n=1 Tax=unclassified Metabacillus TaxID=2675274 RepID=UPI003CE90A77
MAKSSAARFGKKDFNEIYLSLYKYCLMLTRNKWDAEDLAQATICRILEKNNDLSNDLPQAFYNKAAQHLHIDCFRKQKRVITGFTPDDRVEEIMESKAAELSEWVASVMSVKQAAVFVLKEALLFKNEEIAELTGLTLPAVKALLFRARQHTMREDPADLDEELAAAISRTLTEENPQPLLKLLTLVPKQSSGPMAKIAA